MFAEYSLPTVTFGKGFAECKMAFAECLRHSIINVIPVLVHLTNIINRNYNKSTTINENRLNCTYHSFCQMKVIITSIPVIRLGSTIGQIQSSYYKQL
jgi:hypothetical protein